jgi:Spy/CpxP family protein refolding chaperone
MKRFITAVAALAVLAVVAPQAQAQDTTQAQAPTMQQGHPPVFDALLKDITLTAEQQAKVDTIATTYRDQLAPADPQMDSTAAQKQRDVIERAAVDLRAVLDPEQQKTFDKNLADLRSKWGSK